MSIKSPNLGKPKVIDISQSDGDVVPIQSNQGLMNLMLAMDRIRNPRTQKKEPPIKDRVCNIIDISDEA